MIDLPREPGKEVLGTTGENSVPVIGSTEEIKDVNDTKSALEKREAQMAERYETARLTEEARKPLGKFGIDSKSLRQ